MATDGVYGANGTVYSTELASFSKIVSYGTAGNGPAHFKVWTKSGQIMTYGNTADSAVEVPGQNDVRYWSVNRIEDRVGNYLTLTYKDDDPNDATAENTHKITRIDYAGNDSASPATYPKASVRFIYEPRTDTRVHYMAGAKSETVERLKSIETYANQISTEIQDGGIVVLDPGDLVKRYDMAYEYGTATGRSRLTSVTECDASNNCLMPHEFTYSDHTAGTNVFALDSGYIPPNYIDDRKTGVTTGQFQDVNGDGLVDWIRAYRNSTGSSASNVTFLNTGSAWEVTSDFLPRNYIDDRKTGVTTGQFQDVNGDGLVDWVRAYRNSTGSSASNVTFLNTGSAWEVTSDFLPRNYIDDRKTGVTTGQFQDVNGDGLVDWIRAYRNSTGSSASKATFLNTGTSWLLNADYAPPNYIDDRKTGVTRGQFLDVNGDGLPDWVEAYRSASGGNALKRTFLNTGSDWVLNADYAPPNYIDDRKTGVTRGQFLDVNGDGLPDWVEAYRSASGGSALKRTFLNTGSGWVLNADYAPPNYIDDRKTGVTRGQFLDVNGDGLPDWVEAYRSASGGSALKRTFLNTGSGWVLNADYAPPNYIDDRKTGVTRGQFLDVNGDGLPDWVEAYRSASGGSKKNIAYLISLVRLISSSPPMTVWAGWRASLTSP